MPHNNSNKKPVKIAILGGGVAGLACAQRLVQQDESLSSNPKKLLEVTVFDTGRLRPGGRASSRRPGDRPKENDANRSYQYLSQCTVDHAAQVILLPSSDNDARLDDFCEQARAWQRQGLLTAFPPGALCNIVPASADAASFRLQPIDATAAFYGTHGMGSLPLAMANDDRFAVEQDVWVSPSNGARYMTKSGQWKLQASGKVLGYFDQLVIAHNGKCADRLMSKTPARHVHRLRVNFSPRLLGGSGGTKMTLNSIYSLTFAVRADASPLTQALPPPFVSGFVQNEGALRFVTCQTRKHPCPELDGQGVEVWTLLSSPTFAKKYKAPQEFLPEETVEQVTSRMLQALERSLGIQQPTNSLTQSNVVLESRLQLWGAAVPLNVWENTDQTSFLYDAEHSVGVCGDWLVEPSIAGAWTSGRRLAEHLLSKDASTTVGLTGEFQPSKSAGRAGIGSFPVPRETVSS